ncbi:MAG: tetratricopeptide repeat protein [Oceanospirillaceae bacterium]|nr:tetratricopeptide repeat protein [Oceanospirillaceae bacterium]
MPDPKKYLQRALLLLQQGRYNDVISLCQPILQKSPGAFAPRHFYGVALLRLGRLEEAERELQRACSCQAPRAQRAQANSNLALSLQHQGKLEAAADAIQRAVEYAPAEAAYWINHGNICEARRDWQQMARSFEQALALAPGLPEAGTGLAVANRHLGRFENARQTLESSAEQDFDWLCEYVLVLLLQGDESKALAMADQVPDADSLMGLADYVAEAGYAERATPLYRRVLQLEPGNSVARHLLASLAGESLRQAPRQYVEALYDRHAGEFEQRLVGCLGYCAPEMMAQALGAIATDRLDAALDLGCGSGLLGQALTRSFPTLAIDGIDLSSRMLDEARAKHCYRGLLHGDAVSQMAQLPASGYQLIASADMLIYLGDLEPLFEAALRCLAPGGLIAVTVEAGSEDQPQLQPSGRFRHSGGYLKHLVAGHKLQLRLLERFELRQEHDEMIDGLMLIAQAPG